MHSQQEASQCSAHRTFILPIRVYYEDTDAGGVVYHSNYINFFERARTEFMRHLGYELDILEKTEQLAFVVRSLNCDYLLPALFNDELFISASIIELTKTKIIFEQKVMRLPKEGDHINVNENCTTLTKGQITVVTVDSKRFKIKRIPKKIFEDISRVI